MINSKKEEVAVTKTVGLGSYKNLSDDDKIKILMDKRNRGMLRNVLATYVSESTFEIYAESRHNLLELGEVFFTAHPKEKLIINED